VKQPYRFIDAFCGAGGLALGLRQAGFDDAVSFDADEHAVETFRTNISPRVFVARAQDICGKDLLKRAEIDGQLDLFAGGPPCQGFSKQKRGAHLGDERNSLVLEFARLVRETSPRFFLLENVDQLGKKRGRGFLADVQDELQNYVLFPHFYNSADYGLAQTRIRFVIIGRRRDVAAGYRVPVPTVTQWVTVGDVLSGLPEPPENYSEHPYFPNHYRARVTPINIKRFSYVPQGGGWWDIPDKLRLQCHRNVDRGSGGWPDVYGRLKLDGQAPTLTAGFDSFTRGRYGHPLYDRPLTPREAARLQGFPDNYRFYGTRWHVRSQIGNAVPPPLAMVIGASIRRSLDLADGKLQTRADDMSTTPAAVQLGFAMGLG
jgi:DNA (cytosine-5)-methyltransferase 1